MHRTLSRLGALLLVLGIAPQVPAASLLDIYAQAQQSDAQYRSAQAANMAAQEQRPQARAGLLPQASLSANTTGNRQDVQRSGFGALGVNSYNSKNLTLNLTQPIYHRDTYVALRQADVRISQSGAELKASLQDLIVRVATAYFDVLGAQDTLTFANKTKEAISQQLRQAKQRFEVGLIAVTDVQEAQAAHDLAVADEIAAENQRDNAYEALREITGEYHTELQALGENSPLEAPAPSDIDSWTSTALEQNLQLISAQRASELAREEIQRQRSGHYPTLDLVASHVRSESNGGSTGGSESDTSSLSLQFNLPLYSGGLTSARTREAQLNHQQAMEELERARRSAHRQARDAYLGVIAGISRVQALGQALTSTRVALEAIEAGFQVGTRTTVDVVNAQRDVFRARRDYKAARYSYILNTLRLKQAAGILETADLDLVNRWLS